MSNLGTKYHVEDVGRLLLQVEEELKDLRVKLKNNLPVEGLNRSQLFAKLIGSMRRQVAALFLVCCVSYLHDLALF